MSSVKYFSPNFAFLHFERSFKHCVKLLVLLVTEERGGRKRGREGEKRMQKRDRSERDIERGLVRVLSLSLSVQD